MQQLNLRIRGQVVPSLSMFHLARHHKNTVLRLLIFVDDRIATQIRRVRCESHRGPVVCAEQKAGKFNEALREVIYPVFGAGRRTTSCCEKSAQTKVKL